MRTTQNNTDNTKQNRTQNVLEHLNVHSQESSKLLPINLTDEKPD